MEVSYNRKLAASSMEHLNTLTLEVKLTQISTLLLILGFVDKYLF